MGAKTIEGTWEEVSLRSEELAGRRVRVTVLDPVALPGPSQGPSVDDEACAPSAANPILGMFKDAPDLFDEVVEEAMKIREERPWRLPAGE